MTDLDGGETWGKPTIAKRYTARAIVFGICSIVLATRLIGVIRRFLVNDHTRPNTLVIIGTFYNLGWYKAHIQPLAECPAIDRIFVVCDQALDVVHEKVEFACARPETRLPRNAARLVALLSVAKRHRPEIYMGYHIMPNSLFAQVAANLFGGYSIYQMTGGPQQIQGGGFDGENPLLKATQKHSIVQERFLVSVTRGFDAVVVRGSNAKKFVNSLRHNRQKVFTIAGAMDMSHFAPIQIDKHYDLICVARLVPIKGHELLFESIALMVHDRPDLKCALVGGGPLLEDLKKLAQELEISSNIEFCGKISDVRNHLAASKLFILLSKNEGLSIAMLEAMAMGTIPLVTDVGDLADAIDAKNRSKHLIASPDPETVARQALALLGDTDLTHLSSEVSQRVADEFSIEATASKWVSYLRELKTGR